MRKKNILDYVENGTYRMSPENAKLTRGMEQLSYEKRLRELVLFRLEWKRL